MAVDPVELMAGTRRRRAPVHGIWRIRGELDVAVLRQAIDLAGERRGLVRPDRLPAAVSVVELGGAALDDVLGEVVGSGSDLGVGSLLRVAVVRCGPGEHVVVAVLHQLVADREALGAFATQLWDSYAALLSGAAGGFGTTAVDVEVDEEVDFWRERLAGLPAFDFPSDRARPGVKSFRGTDCGADVAGDLVAGVTGLAAELGVDPSVVLLAGWGLVLARCSGTADFAVGVPVPGTGLVRNVVPVRLTYDGGSSFAEWVGAVGRWREEARSHGRVPYERIVAAVGSGRDPSRSPLYQVFFAAEQALPRVAVPGAVAEPWECDAGFAAVDLELVATWTDPGLRLWLTGDADLFDAGTLRAPLDRVTTALAAGVADPARPVSRLPLMDAAEQRRVLVDWNRSGVDVPDRCLHELVEEQVAAGADRVAVRCGGRDLTYGQLNDRANQVAVRLRQAGVGPESRVGMFVDRSVDSVVALLGILKAGGGYVPLDPAYPAERLTYMATDAGLVATVGLLATQPVAAGIAPHATFIAIPTAEDGTPDPAHIAAPRNLAYIIYTSGTTGQPKGVAVTHRQITASTNARWAYPDPGTDLMTLPLTFDAAAGGLHWMLTKGGTCLMPTADEIRDPRLMARLVRGNRITHINTLPSQYRLILDQTDPEDLAALCYVDVGGEVLPPSLVRMHYRRTPDALLTNCYGPTEATVWASVCDVRPHHATAVSVPIGRPIRNARIYLLDADLAPVPPGTPADLYIGGETVARGYLNQPALTAERFIPDPYGTPGQRLYRTGDRARHLPDGDIEFLGRVDQQVKVRGFRIELPEIENVILRHPHVTEAAVTIADAAGNPRVIAHVTGEPLASLPAEVKGWLTEQLPRFMQPDEIRAVAQMPRTATGKVDRARLAAADDKQRDKPAAEIEPSTVDGVRSQDLGHLSDTQLDTLLAQLLSERRAD